jgi:NADPH:quinone reductase-like Zn-dependent oxidoreductase
MKAWQLTDTKGIESYELNEVEEPEPGADEIRVNISHSALNHLDLWVSQGLPAPEHLPHIGGADGAGTVDAVGDNVSGFEVGDEVIIDPSFSCGQCSLCRNDEVVYCDSFQILGEHRSGTFTEKIVIPTINAVRKPSAMLWEVAGSFGLVTATALRMMERAALKPEQTLLVVGVGGGVSAAAMQLGLAMRTKVYVTSRSQDKIDWAVEQGAAGGFLSDTEFGTEMASLGGADVIIENVGPATIRQSMRAAKKGGKIAICGATSGPKMDLTLPALFFRQLELIGSSMANHSQFARATTWVGTVGAKAPVGKVFDFTDLPAALGYLESGDQVGKVVLRHPG